LHAFFSIFPTYLKSAKNFEFVGAHFDFYPTKIVWVLFVLLGNFGAKYGKMVSLLTVLRISF